MTRFLPYGRQQIDDDDVQAVVETLRSDYLTTGPKVPELEVRSPHRPPRWLLDGVLADWESIPRLIEDPLDAETAGVDIRWVGATDDPAWLYLAFDVEREVNALRMPGAFHFLIDADGDASTGGEAGGMEGTELIVEVSSVDDPDETPRPRRVHSRRPGPGAPETRCGPTRSTWSSHRRGPHRSSR